MTYEENDFRGEISSDFGGNRVEYVFLNLLVVKIREGMSDRWL